MGVEVEDGNNFFSACAAAAVGFFPMRSQIVIALDEACDYIYILTIYIYIYNLSDHYDDVM